MISLKTTMIASDYKGDLYNPKDCIGHRAFKRALKQLPWYKRIFIRKGWFNYYNDNNTWASSKGMMHDTKIGDQITFTKL